VLTVIGSTPNSSAASVFGVALRLGLTSFGGPVAHIEYFRRAYVERRRWLDDDEFADLLTMSQVLPGPASSQLGMAIGMRRAGLMGLLAAWLGFTLPSALLMATAGLIAASTNLAIWLHGLKLAAVAVVIAAVIALTRTTIRTLPSALIALGAMLVAVIAPVSWIPLVVIALGAIAGRLLLAPVTAVEGPPASRRGRSPLLLIILLLAPALVLPLLRYPLVELLDAIYRSGALVFGGGHVVLPLLEASVVREGMIDGDTFLAGYGIAQVMPGPLFSFASYLGAVAHGPVGALLATLAIFLPGALLVLVVLPYWNRLRTAPAMRSAIDGANAAVVGVLASVPFLPITRSALISPWDLVIIAGALGLLLSKRVPVLVVVCATALAGLAITL